MVRKLILLLSISLLLVNANAQLGIKLGSNFAKWPDKSLSYSYNEKSLVNFAAGAFYDKDLIPLLDIRIGLDYSPKGYKEVNGDDFNQTKINYLELPLLAKIKIGPFYGLGGVYGAYALNGEWKSHALGINLSDELDFENQEISKWDFGMKFGAGAQIGLGPVHIFGQVDYSFGLIDICSNSDKNYKNNVFGVSAGVLIGFE